MKLDVHMLPELLQEALAAQDEQLRGAQVSEIVRLEGGAVGQAFRFTLQQGEDRARFVLRADRSPGFAPRTDRQREWEIVSWLTRHTAIPAPAARWFLPEDGPLGTNAIVAEFVDAPSLLATAVSRPDQDLDLLAASLAEAAAAIHQVDISHAPPALALPTSWDDYVDGQIELLLRIERDHSEPLPVLRYLARWLAKNKPPPISLGLVHGDFEAPNLLVAEDNSFRIVDWETAKVGDPREDLGWFHMMGSSMVPPDLIGRDTDSFCSRYRELTGVGEEVLNPAVLSYFGVFGGISNLNVCLSFLGDLERGETRGLFATYMPRVLLTFSLAMFNLAAAKTRSTTQ